ncbi:hypothetical protein [Yoonia sp.]|uniref:hypothetical protein n=1 Tax=Yoonia sp. TaxID=2212373 RepID=UPI00358F0226
MSKPKVDYEAAWHSCFRTGEPDNDFVCRIDRAISFYRYDLYDLTYTPSKERSAIYRRLRSHANDLLAGLEQLPSDIRIEVEDLYIGNESADYAEKTEGTDYEAICEFDRDLDLLKEIIGRLNVNLSDADSIYAREKGRRKQNIGLEQAIVELQSIFETYAKRSARFGLSHDAYSSSGDYRGDFMPFLKVVFWSYNGREFPQVGALGETARKILGLKKS